MLPPEIIELARVSPGRLLDNRGLKRRGCHSWQLTHYVREGLLERVVRGFYRIAGEPPPVTQSLWLPQRYLARRQRNCGADGDAAVMTSVGATIAYGSAVFEAPVEPEMLIDQSRRVRLKLDPMPFSVRRVALDDVATARRSGLLVAAPARTLSDLAALSDVTDTQLRQVFYDLVHAERLHLSALIREWHTTPGVGARRMLALAERGDLDVESHGELAFLDRVFGTNPPRPDCQVWMQPGYRVDFAFVFSGLVIDYHGIATHRDRVDEDRWREHELRRHGAEVIVATKSMREDPNGFADYVHERRRLREADVIEGRITTPGVLRDPDRRTPLRTLQPFG